MLIGDVTNPWFPRPEDPSWQPVRRNHLSGSNQPFAVRKIESVNLQSFAACRGQHQGNGIELHRVADARRHRSDKLLQFKIRRHAVVQIEDQLEPCLFALELQAHIL
jgi:hypothetical protein